MYLPTETEALTTALQNLARAPKFLEGCKDITLKQWKEIGTHLSGFNKGLQWAWGAWWICGSFDHGERRKLVEQEGWEGLSYDTLKNYGSVARRFLLDPQMSRRCYTLPFSYCADLAVLPNEEILALMDSCCSKGLNTRSALQAEIAKVKARLRLEKRDLVDLSEPVFAPRPATELPRHITPVKVNTRQQMSPEENQDSECYSHQSNIRFGLSKIVLADPDEVEARCS